MRLLALSGWAAALVGAGGARHRVAGKSAGERTSVSRDWSDPNRTTRSHNWQTKADKQEATGAAAGISSDEQSGRRRCAAAALQLRTIRRSLSASPSAASPFPPPVSSSLQVQAGSSSMRVRRSDRLAPRRESDPRPSRLRGGRRVAGQRREKKRKSGAHKPANPAHHANTTHRATRWPTTVRHDRAVKLLRDERRGIIDNSGASNFWLFFSWAACGRGALSLALSRSARIRHVLEFTLVRP